MQRTRIQIWLYEQTNVRIEGVIMVHLQCWHFEKGFVLTVSSQGFDEYMNLTLDDAEEISLKKGTRKRLGTAFLKEIQAND